MDHTQSQSDPGGFEIPRKYDCDARSAPFNRPKGNDLWSVAALAATIGLNLHKLIGTPLLHWQGQPNGLPNLGLESLDLGCTSHDSEMTCGLSGPRLAALTYFNIDTADSNNWVVLQVVRSCLPGRLPRG